MCGRRRRTIEAVFGNARDSRCRRAWKAIAIHGSDTGARRDFAGDVRRSDPRRRTAAFRLRSVPASIPGSRAMARTPTETSSSFPAWVALASLGVASWLWFANAVPAARERTELRALADHFEDLRRQYDAAIAEARLARGPNAHQDLQGLLVAIDRLGLTPAELCATFPERPAQPTDAPEEPLDGALPPVEPPAAPGAEPIAPPSRVKFQ